MDINTTYNSIRTGEILKPPSNTGNKTPSENIKSSREGITISISEEAMVTLDKENSIEIHVVIGPKKVEQANNYTSFIDKAIETYNKLKKLFVS